MTYYNELYLALYGAMFVMLAVSTIPHYRAHSPEAGHPWLLWTPLLGAASCVLFLLTPYLHRALLTLANLSLMALTWGPVFLLRHWQGKANRKPMLLWVGLCVLGSVWFEYLRHFGNFQERVLLVSFGLVVGSFAVCFEAHRLQRQRHSFYLWALEACAAAVGLAVLVRLGLILGDPPSNIYLFDESLLQMLLRIALGVFQIFTCVFLITCANERLNWHNLAILRAKDRTESMNAELSRLVQERDHMLMINSRFSTVSSLALFNSAIVHELSQPLTALTLTLQEAQWRVQETDPVLQASIANSISLAQKMGRMNQSLRNLMMAQKPDVQALDLGVSLQDMLPILRNETHRRQVHLQEQVQTGTWPVLAHKVLFERIVFNLVANAMDALTGSTNPSLPPEIGIALTPQINRGLDHVVLTVTDNGPGFSDLWLGTDWLHFQSSKDAGMGVGLVLCHYIVGSWHGDLLLSNLPSGGACVQIKIPLISPHPTV